ncbi:hypothetical protein QCA50_013535 [Cerrena zonata]|uniref:Uncharacterized protein n=1 Tax=Cerrena zonata TaxID=2478898 RepID=A0AAW0FNL1_9APHY
MATQFQAVRDVITVLTPKLVVIQKYASEPTSILYNDMKIRTCAIIFSASIAAFQGRVALHACNLVEFLLNNILSSLTDHEVNRDDKIIAIEKFLDSSSLRAGAHDVLSLWDQVHDLHECFNASSHILDQLGLNPTSTLNQFDTILTGIAALQSFYMQVQTSLEGFIKHLQEEETRIQDIEHEVRWLTAMLADLKMFSEGSATSK